MWSFVAFRTTYSCSQIKSKGVTRSDIACFCSVGKITENIWGIERVRLEKNV